jgi:6-pyruvoyltetrahydropterin/6-carboxytetrahydropterin synthase
MVRLARQVRFSINPFRDQDADGANAYASRPAGEGLALFLELTIELVGPVASDTGFVVNVTDMDRIARQFAVPVFARGIRQPYRRGCPIGLDRIVQMLRQCASELAGRFGAAEVDRLILNLNPYRKLTMDAKEPHVLHFSEKFEFAAMHKLWNDAFSDERNFEVFGKCAHPTGHGHNYVVDVSVSVAVDAADFETGRFQQTVETELISLLDHKNLNADLDDFREAIPTVENLATFAWRRLVGKFDPARLHSVTIWESDRTYCTCTGPEGSDWAPENR